MPLSLDSRQLSPGMQAMGQESGPSAAALWPVQIVIAKNNSICKACFIPGPVLDMYRCSGMDTVLSDFPISQTRFSIISTLNQSTVLLQNRGVSWFYCERVDCSV